MYSSYRTEIQRVLVTRFELDVICTALRTYGRALDRQLLDAESLYRGEPNTIAALEEELKADIKTTRALLGALDDNPF